MIKVNNLSGGYNSLPIVKDMSFSVDKGSFFGILGPNGCGKTTLLKLLTGILPKNHGEIKIDGQALENYESKELARKMTLLPQQPESSFSYSVKEVVAMGRYPYKKGIFHFYDKEDEEKVNSIMNRLGLKDYENMPLPSLSGGEQQRVFLARALVQEPKILLLDEPTNHLDISFQIELMDQIKELVIHEGLTVIAVLHDLNIASLYCDEIILLEAGKLVHQSAPNSVLTETILSTVYSTDLKVNAHPSVPNPLVTFQPKHTTSSTDLKLEHFDKSKVWELEANRFLKTLSTSEKSPGFTWNNNFVFYKKPTLHVDNIENKFVYDGCKAMEEQLGYLYKNDEVEILLFQTKGHEVTSIAVFINTTISNTLFYQLYIKIGQWISQIGERGRILDPHITLTSLPETQDSKQEQVIIDKVYKLFREITIDVNGEEQ